MSMFGSKPVDKLPGEYQKTYKCHIDFCKGRARYKDTIGGFIYYKCPRCGNMFHTGKKRKEK